MPSLSLKSLVGPRSSAFATVQKLMQSLGDGLCILDGSGKLLLGEPGTAATHETVPIRHDDATLGFVGGPSPAATTLAALLTHLAARESESRSLASEVLHLYREINLIEQLSEQLAPLLELEAVSQAALAQAQRLIPATHGQIFVIEKPGAALEIAASFADGSENGGAPSAELFLHAESRFVTSILERGVAEIVNDCSHDPRAKPDERDLQALICAPLRAGQRTVGVIALASTAVGASCSAANLKLLNTIALQTAAAIENSLLVAEMVHTARERAALAAEFQAASTVQQLLLQSALRSTPGFKVDSVYLPASEVGGDFFLVSPAPDGSITAIVGDVSGKGLTAAMRVAMILGALRRESSHEPDTILVRLNNVLIHKDQLGFTTACCIRIALSGEFTLANAGHIAPYLEGQEITTAAALPLGLVPDQSYELTHGVLGPREHLVLMSDGVPEARSETGALYGFERLPSLTRLSAAEIAQAAQEFGQEDDITVVTLALAAAE